ncbi:hypothetical protein [Runella sp.]|uniref:hypothetical protein n=1 Tax=Runella sp. TaxID=1960881 RepID=UPI003D0F866A
MEDLNNYLLADKLCPITGLSITIAPSKDHLFAISYIIDGLNPHCTIRILGEVIVNKPIMDFLRNAQKSFGHNLVMTDAEEIIITLENYLNFVAQLYSN